MCQDHTDPPLYRKTADALLGDPLLPDAVRPPLTGIPDTADLVDPNAPDPEPDEITDPDDPSYVEPWDGS